MDTQLNEMVEKWVAARHQEIPEGTLLGWAVRQVAVTCQAGVDAVQNPSPPRMSESESSEEARIAARAHHSLSVISWFDDHHEDLI